MKKQNETEVVQAWQKAVQAEVKTRPWFAALLLQKGNQLFPRFAQIYHQLLTAPRKVRRQLGVGLSTAALILALSQTPAHAATITVDPGAAGTGIAIDGQCSLVEAIINANDGAAAHADCDSGSAGADIIVLAGNSYNYTTAYGTGSALPNITSNITIEANGATIQRDNIAPDMRIIRVNLGGNLTLNNATITGGNVGNPGGGGILNFGTITLNNSTVSGNESPMWSGGGILNNGGTTTLNGSTVSNNKGYGSGGIVNYDGGTITLNNSTISGNEAYGSGGGGIHNFEGTTTLNNSTVSGNISPDSGGGITNRYGTTTLNNSTVSGNSAAIAGGGGIANYGGDTITLNNSTVSGNSAPSGSGGGIFNFASTTNLIRTIVSGNTASSSAEIHNNDAGTVNANDHNVFGHSGLTNAQAFSGFTPGATDINATSDGTTPTDLANILNPTLANNGGPTLTHALVSGSPAIDIALAAACSGAPINGVDQRGVSRSIDGDLDSTAACDAGAVEQAVPEVCGVAIETDYTLAGATLNIANLGTDLACFQVALINHNHPNATSSGSSDALETGRFWRIHALQSDVSTPATTDYNVSLTLPFAGANDHSRVCKWLDGVGPDFGWDCDNSTTSHVDNTSVTRTGISSFSDWAVGDAVGPTAVINLHTQTNTPNQTPLIPLLATLLTLLSGAWLWLRRSTSQPSPVVP